LHPFALEPGAFYCWPKLLDELTTELQQAVLGIEQKVVLRLNPKDAKELMFHVGASNLSQLVDLAPGEAFGRKANPPRTSDGSSI